MPRYSMRSDFHLYTIDSALLANNPSYIGHWGVERKDQLPLYLDDDDDETLIGACLWSFFLLASSVFFILYMI